MAASYLFVASSIPLLYVVDRRGIPLGFAIVFGFGLGADYMMIPLMAAQTFGPNSLARAMGVIWPVGSIGQTCMPFLIGVLRDRGGNYEVGLLLLSALALVGALAIIAIPGRKAGSAAPVAAVSGVSS